MDRIINWIIFNDLINYSNFFLAAVIGSAGGIMNKLADDDCELKEVFLRYASNAIIGGFVGMFATYFTDVQAVLYGVSGIVGGVGLKGFVITFNNFLEAFKGGQNEDTGNN